MGSLSLNTISWTSLPSTKALKNIIPKPLSVISLSRLVNVKACTTSAGGNPQPMSDRRTINFSGAKLQETVDVKSEKLRLDSWVSSRIHGISRARVQSSIRSGLVSVNGRIINKVSHMVRGGDKVNCTISELQQLRAEPEDIPLDIVYEDDHLLVVNKPAHMVVHPAPGNTSGTLVNGILHHCSLPMLSLASEEVHLEPEDASDDEFIAFPRAPKDNGGASSRTSEASIRPGIVHRLDKGTSGLLVVAKDEHSHSHLAEQFKNRTIKRVYVSLTCGVPSPVSGRVDIPVGRDSNNRIRMAVFDGSTHSQKTRNAASRYSVVEVLAGGGSALVEWKLETGRTHQIYTPIHSREHAFFSDATCRFC
ncbi:RNA pseudouridine synthase 2, chloroplastic isoform X2 [Coffea arabica]|uniref:RNA pseudouridine synthase 2, chloroplastic isoform X2 n=1 Tax=Coffea arabica TaxID=13443 RepID=A0A6P6UK61_COFAR|nr:RNA pseudouridine synthase 2, chloroplastic isoform X3 [Coffea arabica]XP_027090869.1 RNA pseudouridine synthase 2, chloroplastic isoform X3 [Coffea arabica]